MRMINSFNSVIHFIYLWSWPVLIVSSIDTWETSRASWISYCDSTCIAFVLKEVISVEPRQVLVQPIILLMVYTLSYPAPALSMPWQSLKSGFFLKQLLYFLSPYLIDFLFNPLNSVLIHDKHAINIGVFCPISISRVCFIIFFFQISYFFRI